MIQTKQLGHSFFIWDRAQIDKPTDRTFNPEYWAQKNALLGHAGGRATAYFVQSGRDNEWVIRHYCRGGWVAHFNYDRYMWHGVENTRMFREFRLLAQMCDMGISVATPVAARVKRCGLFYQGDLMTVKAPATQTLAQRLKDKPLAQTRWQALGQTLSLLHQNNIYHHDLNAKNILIDKAGGITLIDFDKSGFRKPGPWREKNITRLKRSLDKISRQEAPLKMSASNWQGLLRAYQNAWYDNSPSTASKP